MEAVPHIRSNRTRGVGNIDVGAGGRRPHSRNKHWTPAEGGSRSGSSTPNHVDGGERWERGGHRGRGARGGTRGGGGARKFPNASLRLNPLAQSVATTSDQEESGEHEVEEGFVVGDKDPETQEEREKFYQELVKAREVERKRAIADGKMDDPLTPKRLEDAISVVGTCMDMCPRFERYRRERENNLFEWEVIPGTKRVDHKRAVKMYERAAGDKTLPSDLRPPHVLKSTLDYLFHDLLPRNGFSETFNFIRDRSRAVRNDFTMQHNTGSLAIECHDRCARFHILALHFERERKGFSVALEEQQLMNTLQSLKEYYEDQRGRYESPNELEMRVYHRLIHIRDQKERHEDIPEHITSHPVFKLTTDFRLHVQRKSAPISKVSPLVVDAEGMNIFGRLAGVLRDQGSVVMIYLVACILERLFGPETIDDIEAIRGNLTVPDIIDGISTTEELGDGYDDSFDQQMDDELEEDAVYPESTESVHADLAPTSATEWSSSAFGPQPAASVFGYPSAAPSSSAPAAAKPISAFSSLAATPNVFGTKSVFGTSAFSTATKTDAPTSVFGGANSSVFGQPHVTLSPTPATVPPPASTPASAPSFTSASTASPFVFAAPKPPAGGTSTPVVPSFSPQQTARPTPPLFGSSTSLFGSIPSPSSNKPTVPPSLLGTPPAASSANGFPPKTFASGGASAESNTLFSVSAITALNPLAPAFIPPSAPQTQSTISLLYGATKHAPSNPLPQFINGSPAQATTPAVPSAPLSPFTNNQPAYSPLPASRASDPLPLTKIVTTPTKTTFADQQALPSTPREPPALARKVPISLPSTPTLAAPLNHSQLGFLKTNLDTPLTRSNTEILSPLVLATPSGSMSSLANHFSPSAALKAVNAQGVSDRLNGLVNEKSKALKTTETTTAMTAAVKPMLSPEEAKVKALTFAQKSLLVKECFERWRKRASDKTAWLEACRHSDAYRQKIQHRRPSHASLSDKKRRISTGPGVSLVESPEKKRARRRVSSEYRAPRTDEELAQRLKENHEEHERRWAQGSLLKVIRTSAKEKAKSGMLPDVWRIWLSMNPDSDATAIWLERKFDVSDSGKWVSETVFSMPLVPRKVAQASDFPGLIVFECTPLEGVTDDIERKYRILDDCARLRDIIKLLPPKRRFIPSLLVLCWAEEGQTPSSDFSDMIKKLLKDLTLDSFAVFSLTPATKDLDSKFEQALDSLSLDLSGKLVQQLTLRGVFKLFEPVYGPFTLEWVENCSVNGDFDWHLYGRVARAAVALLNSIADLVSALISVEVSRGALLSPFNPDGLIDSDSVYDAANSWLADSSMSSLADNVTIDLQSHRDIGQDFPAQTFLNHLRDLLQFQAELCVGRDSKTRYHVPTTDITTALETLKRAIQPHQTQLGQALSMSVRRSPPKRRGVSEDTDMTSPQNGKRRRLSASASVDSRFRSPTPSPRPTGTPSPSNSTVSLATTESAAPLVTVSMLRALTKDLKQKYAQYS